VATTEVPNGDRAAWKIRVPHALPETV